MEKIRGPVIRWKTVMDHADAEELVMRLENEIQDEEDDYDEDDYDPDEDYFDDIVGMYEDDLTHAAEELEELKSALDDLDHEIASRFEYEDDVIVVGQVDFNETRYSSLKGAYHVRKDAFTGNFVAIVQTRPAVFGNEMAESASTSPIESVIGAVDEITRHGAVI
jgi:hypothetical protein